MLKRSRATLATMLFVLGSGILISALTSSPSFQDCYATANKDEAKKEQQSTVSVIVNGPWHMLRCEAVSLDENNGAVTAAATLAIAGFTLILWLATTRQAFLTSDIIGLTREEFPASHRPLLVVHSIRILETDPSKLPDDQPLRVQFGVINAGTSAGTVTGSAVYLDVTSRIDRRYLPEMVPNNIISLRRFDVGATDNRVEVTSDRYGYANFIGNRNKTPYLSGFIVYKDGRGHSRTTFFCRQFERFPESNIDGRFVPVDDPDSERTY
jgi:hypothetical protein